MLEVSCFNQFPVSRPRGTEGIGSTAGIRMGAGGGTLERPALQRLLSDIEDGLVDVVVVYKIDRLSRSLMDFSKLVEVFDRNNVTFVSVTQSFNTTTSMGRLIPIRIGHDSGRLHKSSAN